LQEEEEGEGEELFVFNVARRRRELFVFNEA
jgi:hypothetical protein